MRSKSKVSQIRSLRWMAETKKLEKDLANSKKDSEKWMDVARTLQLAGDEDAARHGS